MAKRFASVSAQAVKRSCARCALPGGSRQWGFPADTLQGARLRNNWALPAPPARRQRAVTRTSPTGCSSAIAAVDPKRAVCCPQARPELLHTPILHASWHDPARAVEPLLNKLRVQPKKQSLHVSPPGSAEPRWSSACWGKRRFALTPPLLHPRPDPTQGIQKAKQCHAPAPSARESGTRAVRINLHPAAGAPTPNGEVARRGVL